MDSWTVHLYNMMDTNTTFITALYFCLLILFGSFFLLNLILAVILDSFTKVQQEELKFALNQNEDGLIEGMLHMMQLEE